MPELNEDPPDHGNGSPRRAVRTAAPAVIRSAQNVISAELALTVFRQMLRTRALEERSIKMSKSGEAFFWIGGPGEEAFNVCLGLQIHKGRGPAHDYTHLHYRSAGVMLALGMPMIDHVRQLAMRATEVETGSGGKRVADRAIPYGIRAETIDGNDPIATWHAIDRAMKYCRRERKPFLLEAMVSRLHGHSSSSGAQRSWNEADPLALFEQKLIDAGAIDVAGVKALKDEAKAEADAAVVETMKEAQPVPEDVE